MNKPGCSNPTLIMATYLKKIQGILNKSQTSLFETCRGSIDKTFQLGPQFIFCTRAFGYLATPLHSSEVKSILSVGTCELTQWPFFMCGSQSISQMVSLCQEVIQVISHKSMDFLIRIILNNNNSKHSLKRQDQAIQTAGENVSNLPAPLMMSQKR